MFGEKPAPPGHRLVMSTRLISTGRLRPVSHGHQWPQPLKRLLPHTLTRQREVCETEVTARINPGPRTASRWVKLDLQNASKTKGKRSHNPKVVSSNLTPATNF